MRRIEPLTEQNAAAWDGFLAQDDRATLFHTVQWKLLIEKTYGYDALHFLVYDDEAVEGVCCAFFVRSLLYGKKVTTSPFNFYMEPLFTTPEAGREIFARLKLLAQERGAPFVEFKARSPFDQQLIDEFGLLEKRLYTRTLIPIKEPAAMQAGLKRLARRMIARCEEEGLSYEITTKREDFAAFYAIMAKLYSRKHHTLYQPFTLFENYLTYLVPQGNAYLLAAKKDGKMFGGTLLFAYKRTLFDQWSLSDLDEKGLSPNYFLIWNSLVHGHGKGFAELDLGYTSPHDEGLTSFKDRWGGATTPVIFYYLPLKKTALPEIEYHESFKLTRKILSHLPSPVFSLLSKALVRHFG